MTKFTSKKVLNCSVQSCNFLIKRLITQIMPILLPTIWNAFKAMPICSYVWAAESWVLILAIPFGTIGYEKLITKTPSFISCLAIKTAWCSSLIIIGTIGQFSWPLKLKPDFLSPVRNWIVFFRSYSSISVDSSSMLKASIEAPRTEGMIELENT